MHKRLTIDIDEKVYEGLYATIGQRKISQFVENLVKPHVLRQDLELAYREMVLDEERELEANTLDKRNYKKFSNANLAYPT